MSMVSKVMIMAGGTGGHVFPALAVAEQLCEQGVKVCWLGTRSGMEARLLSNRQEINFFAIPISGLRGKHYFARLVALAKLVVAMICTFVLLLREKPDVVLGMGGYASGPGGVAAKLLGRPLLIHEQNSVPGTTNQLLARCANKVMTAFPGSFSNKLVTPLYTGNPLRKEILAHCVSSNNQCHGETHSELRLLILGGSQGALKLNHLIPEVLAQVGAKRPVNVIHQTGGRHLEITRENYVKSAVQVELKEFIEDMASAYSWADLVICRAGAMTIAEISAIGVGAILIPYPYATDDHQTVNARHLSDLGAAILIPEHQLTVSGLAQILMNLDYDQLANMAEKVRSFACLDATKKVASVCMEYIND